MELDRKLRLLSHGILLEHERAAGPVMLPHPLVRALLCEALDHPDRLALYLPVDEREAVEELDGCRERLRARGPFPLVLFLMRDGAGQRALAEAPGLASWVRGSDPDPELLAEIDPTAERAAFVEATGSAPEEWLARWRRDGDPVDGGEPRPCLPRDAPGGV